MDHIQVYTYLCVPIHVYLDTFVYAGIFARVALTNLRYSSAPKNMIFFVRYFCIAMTPLSVSRWVAAYQSHFSAPYIKENSDRVHKHRIAPLFPSRAQRVCMAEMFARIRSRINTKALSPERAQYSPCYSARRNLTLSKWKVSVHFPESGAVRSIVPEQRCFEGLSLLEALVMRHYSKRGAASKPGVFTPLLQR